MARETVDIFISGAGIAGLVGGIALARAGFSVVVVDPNQPPNDGGAANSDLRSTAFLKPALQLLNEIGAWEALASLATPLETLRVIELTGTPPAIDTERAFQSSDLGEPAFGWNLPNWLTRSVLSEIAADVTGLELIYGTRFERLVTRVTAALITLDNGRRFRARLAIGADGRASALREAAGIDVTTKRYGQKALAFAVTHAEPHNNISTELYHTGGAFVLVPLPDQNGHPASSVVWMQDGPEAQRLAGLDADAFAEAASLRAASVLGPLSLISERRIWPVITQSAKALTAERVALVAEAAHVLPPIGAQGLNMSLQDIRVLLDLARTTPDQIGDAAFLARYAAARARDVQTRAAIIDLYNRLCRSDALPLHALRASGLKLVHDIAPIRTNVMRAGMGTVAS